jgi:signal transduction histidine kinase
MALQFERKFTLILLFAVLVLTTIGFAFYRNTISGQEAIAIEKRTQDVVSTFDDIDAVVLDANSAVDSFVLLGVEDYLAPYKRARPLLERDIAKLRAAQGLTPTSRSELDNIEKTIAAVFARLDEKVALRKSTDFETAVGQLAKTDDREMLRDLRAASDRAQAAEFTNLQAWEEQMEASDSRTILFLIVSCVAGIGSLALTNFVVFRETSKRSRAERELIELNRGLEERIDERTAELTAANAELQKAAEERGLLLANEQTARREAEVANRLRDEFMATVSHELRTPLNSILGWARLMHHGSLSGEQEKKAIETIINNAEMQNRLIEDLLDVARIVSGKLELDRSDFELSELISGTISTVQPASSAKKISIEFDEPGEALIVNGDKSRVEQIMLNLLTNAIKFSPVSSVITVSAAVADGNAEVRVRDRGAGIKPDFLPLVFERFRQDASTAAGSGGLGLGLAIVRNLVEMHGGSVSVDSGGENQGSEFTVRLPLKAWGSMAAST